MIKLSRRLQVFHGRREYIDPDWRELLREAGISEDGKWLDTDGELVASGRATKCYRMTLSNGEVIYFKRYRYIRLHPQFFFMPSKAIIELAGYRHLQSIGFDVPEVIAYGEQRRMGEVRGAFIVTREIPNTVNMEEFAYNEWYYMERSQRKAIYEAVSDQIIDMTRRMHASHFYHYDLKWRNILLQKTSAGYKAWFIDCPRSRISYLRPYRGQDMDISGMARIAMFYLRRAEQLRWLCKFTGDNKKAKKLFRRIQRHLKSRYPKDPRPPGATQESI